VGEPLPLPPLPTPEQVDLRKLDPKLFRGAAQVASDIVPGSNNFAVDGTLTDNGAALVANDMHLSLRVPNIWFRARIQYTGDGGRAVDLIGVTLPGVPSLVAGSNRHIAWAFTNSYGDWVDLAEVHWLDAAHTRYRGAGGPAEVRTFAESIAIKGAPAEILQVRETEWGPIAAEAGPDTSWSIAWTAHRRKRPTSSPASSSRPTTSTPRSRSRTAPGSRRRTSWSATPGDVSPGPSSA
jgi:penicillin amidase